VAQALHGGFLRPIGEVVVAADDRAGQLLPFFQ